MKTYSKTCRSTLRLPLALCLLAVSLSAAATNYKPTVADVTEFNGLETLSKALDEAGLKSALAGPDVVTLYAPVNQAFDNAAEALGCTDGHQLVRELSHAGALTEVLLDHVAQGRRYEKALLKRGEVDLLSGRSARVEVSSDGVAIIGVVNAKVLGNKPAIVGAYHAINGKVYWINEVIVNVEGAETLGLCQDAAS